MQRGNRYSVVTSGGKLELTKGSYLTLMKRNKPIQKTTRPHPQKRPKPPKPTLQQAIDPLKSSIQRLLANDQDGKFQAIERWGLFPSDGEIYSCMSLPVIPLSVDNDCESEWAEITQGVTNLSWSLSIATLHTIPTDNL